MVPARTSYDKKVQLKSETMVRINKIYTIRKNQLQFKIKHKLKVEEINEIIIETQKAIST